MRSVVDYLRRNPARVYGFAMAALALVAFYLPATPVVLIGGVVATGLALFGGEKVQRLEDNKTADAYWTNPEAL